MRSRLAAGAARPARVARGTLGAMFTRIPLGAAIGMVSMLVAASLLSRGLGAGFLARTGAWSANAILLVIGLLGGLVLGATLAASRVLDIVHDELRAWFERVPAEEQERLLPSVPTERLRANYEGTVEAIFDQSVGRLPLPGPARRFVRARFGHELAERFISDFERKGTPTVGFGELRDWLLVEGWSFATRPARFKIKFWRVLAVGVLGVLFIVCAAVGLAG